MDPTNKRPESSHGSEFDQDLEAIRSVWSPMEQREPPDLVDQAVLNTARRELGGRRRPLRWLGAFATASVIVLTLAIVIQQDPAPPVVAEEADGLKLERPMRAEPRSKANGTADPGIPTAAAAPAAAPVSAPAATRSMPVTAAEESGFNDSDQALQSRVLSERRMEAAAAKESPEAEAPTMLEKEARDDILLPAEEWIARLLQLRENGQEVRLTEELAAFLEAYPDHPLPPELVE
jgi:hypothetical protein